MDLDITPSIVDYIVNRVLQENLRNMAIGTVDAACVVRASMLIPWPTSNAHLVLPENTWQQLEAKRTHALIVTQARVPIVQPPVATTVARGHITQTQGGALASNVMQGSIMLLLFNQVAKTVLPASFIRIQGWHTAQNIATLVK